MIRSLPLAVLTHQCGFARGFVALHVLGEGYWVTSIGADTAPGALA